VQHLKSTVVFKTNEVDAVLESSQADV